jgi:tRNA threonylcarbamoyladenosine biosynthesis protein TsaE
MRLQETANDLAIEIESELETAYLGSAIAATAEPDTVIGLSGPLGAGKTRLVRAVAEALGVDPVAVSSPTYLLIHEYQGRIPVYHIDVYRLGGPEPFEALGVAEYWNCGGICLVEWADLVEGLLPVSAWRLTIEPAGGERRNVLLRSSRNRAIARVLTGGNTGF